ncbi:MAG: hypothetical protein ABIO39_04955 [Caulobacteraceae bacterium]
MKTAFATLAAALVAGASLMAAHQAAAQSEPSITLYDPPNYRGGSATFYRSAGNLDDTRFNDRAMSAQVRGVWRVCENASMKAPCQDLTGNVPDLASRGLGGRISSLEPVGDNGYRGGGSTPPPPPYVDSNRYQDNRYPDNRYQDGRGRDDRDDRYPNTPPPRADVDNNGVQGRSTVFFARPSMGGADVAATRTRAADEFCRRAGLNAAVFFDQSEQSRRAVDLDGRYVGNAPVLRDVLCRR